MACGATAVGLTACGAGSHPVNAATSSVASATVAAAATTTVTTTVTTTTTATVTLPGAGKPPVTIGDENLPEQFILGQLYYQALKAQGFQVTLNQSIGPTQVVMQSLATGQLAMYPEYLDNWDSQVAGLQQPFKTRDDAYTAGLRYALKHGLVLLNPTPFSNTNAIAVSFNYAVENEIQSIPDLIKMAPQLTLGGPPQFQQSTTGLPAIQSTYGLVPATFKPLEIGSQYQALDQGTVQAAVVNTTDPQLLTGSYPLLHDPEDIFGWGNVVPVVSSRALDAEGPVFEATINRVSSLLTLAAIRELNSAVVLSGQDPAVVAQQFLQDQGILPPPASPLAARPEAPRAPLGQRQLLDLDHLGRLHPDQHQLRDPIAGRDLEPRRTVGVQQQHAHLTPVSGVDQTRSVHQRDPVLGGQSGARQHQAGLAIRNLDRHAGADRGPLAGGQHAVLERVQVESGIAGIRPGRQPRAGVEPPDSERHANGRLSANSW